MRSVLVFSVIVGLCWAGGAQKSGFDGKWELDKSQSTATSDIPDGLEEQIKHKGSDLVIQSKWRELSSAVSPMVLLGVLITDLKLSTNGTPTVTQMGPFGASATTKEDGNTITTNWQSTVNGQSVTGQWTRTLSGDGKNMTLDIQQTSAEGKAGNAKLVFKRK